MRINDFLLYECKISLKLMETFRIVVEIIENGKNEDATIEKRQFDDIKWFVCCFGDPHPLCKYDLLKENNPTYLLHNVLYMVVIFSIYILFISIVPLHLAH